MFGIGIPDIFCLAFGFGPQEIMLFVLILVVLFGANRLPSLMRNLGRSATEFKKGMRDDVDEAVSTNLEQNASADDSDSSAA